MPDPRNKVVVAAVAVVATALVFALTMSIWQAVRARNAEQAAREKAALAIAERNTAVEARRAADQERERSERQRIDAERHLYVASMNLVPPAREQSNLGRVRQLLEDTAASPQRGFEWYYWQRQAHLELMTLLGHLGAVLAVAFSADSQRIVTAYGDGTASVWEAASGKELLTLRGQSRDIHSVALSPDGQRIVTGSWEPISGMFSSALPVMARPNGFMTRLLSVNHGDSIGLRSRIASQDFDGKPKNALTQWP